MVADTSMRRRRGLAVALATLFAGAVATTPAHAAPAWLRHFDAHEAEPGLGIQNERLVIDAHGDVFASWESPQGGTMSLAQVAERPAGGSWQTPVTLSEPGEQGFTPQVAVDSEGGAVVVWEGYNATTGARSIHSSTTSAGESWQAPADLSSPGQFVTDPLVATDASGDAVATWELHTTEWMVEASRKSVGGAWSAPVTIVHTGSQAPAPRVFSDAAGETVAIWTGTSAGQQVIQAASEPAGGPWGSPVNLSAPGQDEAGPQLRFDAEGDAIAVWQANTAGIERIESAYRPAAGSWQAAVPLSQEGQEAYAPSISMDPQGDAVAGWEHYLSGCESILQTSVRPSAGTWQPVTNVSTAGHTAEGGNVYIDTHGAVAVWGSGQCSETNREAPIEAAVKPTGGGWEPPTRLTEEKDPLQTYSPQLAGDTQGDAVALWLAYSPSTRTGAIQGAAHDGAGPLLEGLSIPPTASPGQLLAFSVSPFDVWSALGATRWAFGDGASATGPSVTHAYATPGSYQVTVESEDVLGNQTTTTASVEVPPAISRVLPHHGPTIGGTLVRIRGEGFTGATAVHFGSIEAASFTVVSPTKIKVIAPPGSGTEEVTVTGPGGTSGITALDQYTYRTPRVP